MFRRLILAAAMVAAAVLAVTSGASTQVGTNDTSVDPSLDVAPALSEQAQMQQAQVAEQEARARDALLDHHAQLEAQRDAIQENSLEHQERQREQLDERAPEATIAPMATIPPPPPPAD